MKKTKMVCTIGPKSESKEMLNKVSKHRNECYKT
jgi:pyruvate kinase